MKISAIRTEVDYDQACDRLFQLAQMNLKTGSQQEDELIILRLLVDDYQNQHYPFNRPEPIEAVKFAMGQMELKQKDIAWIFGGQTRISEVLTGKRELNLKMIYNLHKHLKIPYKTLIGERPEFKVENIKKRRQRTHRKQQSKVPK